MRRPHPSKHKTLDYQCPNGGQQWPSIGPAFVHLLGFWCMWSFLISWWSVISVIGVLWIMTHKSKNSFEVWMVAAFTLINGRCCTSTSDLIKPVLRATFDIDHLFQKTIYYIAEYGHLGTPVFKGVCVWSVESPLLLSWSFLHIVVTGEWLIIMRG